MRKAKSNLGSFLSRGFLAGTLAFTSYTAKADVLVEPVDSVQTTPIAKWERGQTYSVDVWTTNNGPESVYSGQWKLNIPAAMQPYLTNMNWFRPASQLDFFEGNPLFFQVYAPAGSLSGATLDGAGSVTMPPGKTGSLETYDFLVDANTPLGVFDFTLTSLQYRDNTNALIPRTITNNQQFEIVPAKGDANLDGLIGVEDAATFTDVLLGNNTDQYSVYASDMNNDGDTDGQDIQPFINKLLGQ